MNAFVFFISCLIVFITSQNLSHTCPKFTCSNSTNQTCVNSLNNGPGNFTVQVDNVCTPKQECNFDIAGSFANQSYSNNCTNITLPSNFQYLGEYCSNDTDCISFKTDLNSTCQKNKCTILNDTNNNTCNLDEECYVGFYCNSTNYCASLNPVGGKCNVTSQCVQNAFCEKINGTCLQYNSIKDGIKFDTDEQPYLVCQSYAAYSDNTCGLPDYSGATLAAKNGDNLVPCNYSNSSCTYDRWNGTCECGYNADGLSYCTLPPKYSQNGYKLMAQSYFNSNSNLCHTKHRGNDCRTSNFDYDTALKNYRLLNQGIHQTINYNKFYKAVQCAYVLDSGFLKISFALILSVVVVLI